MDDCKHEHGWVVERKQLVFVFPDEQVTLGFVSKGARTKLIARCNNPDCPAIRNIYVKANLLKYGKIKFNCFCKNDKDLKVICKECCNLNERGTD